MFSSDIMTEKETCKSRIRILQQQSKYYEEGLKWSKFKILKYRLYKFSHKISEKYIGFTFSNSLPLHKDKRNADFIKPLFIFDRVFFTKISQK